MLNNLRAPSTALALAALASCIPTKSAASNESNSPTATTGGFAEPHHVLAKKGVLDSPLHVVFGNVDIPGAPIAPGAKPKTKTTIDVRGYALPKKNRAGAVEPMIPGPTFVFQPGDLLRLRFQNRLNRSSNPRLNDFENNPQVGRNPAAGDDTDEHAAHEISIPNDSDVTNLHVHGLHVDPKQDDVTLLILPQDNDPSGLSPELQRFVPNINRWWARRYQYKIPLDHLPGTYWYHAHKHGSTSTQVENGMAGTLLMRPLDDESTLVPGLWNAVAAKTHDRVMVLQQIANFGVQQGRKAGQPKSANLTSGLNTVNGQYQSTLSVPSTQVERWRFVFAGANHKAAFYLWVGSQVPELDPKTLADLESITSAKEAAAYLAANKNPIQATLNCYALPGAVKLVAADGITIWNPQNITPTAPVLGNAGNRIDLVVQPRLDELPKAAKGRTYRVFRNYPTALDPADLAAAYPALFGEGVAAAKFRLQVLTNANSPPTVSVVDGLTKKSLSTDTFNGDPYQLRTNYQKDLVYWAKVDENGKMFIPATPIKAKKKGKTKKNGSAPATFKKTAVIPLLRGLAAGKGVVIDPKFPTDFETSFAEKNGRWQPFVGNGGRVVNAILLKLDLSGKATGRTDMPSDKELADRASSLSPAGSGSRLKRVDPSSRQLRCCSTEGPAPVF